MSLGPALDVALGLAFVFVLLSIIGSAMQELIAAFMSSRGKMLASMLRQMLAHDPVTAPGPAPASLYDRVLGHALIGAIKTPNRPRWLGSIPWLGPMLVDRPRASYIPSHNFALALVDVLRAERDAGPAVFAQIGQAVAALPNGTAKTTLTVFLADANGDLQAFKRSVQRWYDNAMDRIAGAYKRYAQYMLLLIGLVLAILLNVDALRIANTLWRDPQVRVAVASVAADYLKNNPNAAKPASANDPNGTAEEQAIQRAENAEGLFAVLPAPIGWTVLNEPGLKAGSILLAIIGWLLTGCAVSLGAPFWFDALQKLANLRGAGPVPPRANGSTGN